ncbi:MAG TPA: helix-turn-helix transcriptional regulator [Candidatus Limnocylindria bacterium]|nr:helix-turn-helix transcriptional regulator [Candidatus Limnocylindria bacterium]
MSLDRARPHELGRKHAANLRRWVGNDIKLLRLSSGQTQRQISARAGIAQSFESAIERGIQPASMEVLASLAAAGGGRLVVRVSPGDGISLRDSGQLEVVQLIAGECHRRWRKTVERAVGRPPDRRAADLVVEIAEEVDMIEVERAWVDHQAQYRPLQLKRQALAEELGRRVNLIIGLLDTDRSRSAMAGYEAVIRDTLPVSSRRIWSSLRSGEPIGGDGILWIRPSLIRSRRERQAHA